MSKNPIGPDGFPMERHHPGRLPIQTVLITKTEHDLIHEDERAAVREIFIKDGLSGNPGAWTAKSIKSSS